MSARGRPWFLLSVPPGRKSAGRKRAAAQLTPHGLSYLPLLDAKYFSHGLAEHGPWCDLSVLVLGMLVRTGLPVLCSLVHSFILPRAAVLVS